MSRCLGSSRALAASRGTLTGYGPKYTLGHRLSACRQAPRLVQVSCLGAEQIEKQWQRSHAVQLVSLLLQFFRLFLQVLSPIVQPGFDGVLRTSQSGCDLPDGRSLDMEEEDTHPLLFRQGIDHLPDQLLGFLPCVGKLRLTLNAVILDPVFKILPFLLCLHLGKQHGVLLNQHIFGGIGHDPPQPSGEGLRFRQHIQPCKCPDVGFLQHILGGLFIFHILKGQIIFTLVSGFIEKPVSSLIPLLRKGYCLFIIHVFPPACRDGFSAGLLSNYKMRVTFRQCFPSFPMAFSLRRTIR